MAIFEFSSSNGSSFNLLYECRVIEVREIGDRNQSHISYLVELPYDFRSYTSCEERGYEEWKANSHKCITTFQGYECSMISLL